jgi:hypothetical protein
VVAFTGNYQDSPVLDLKPYQQGNEFLLIFGDFSAQATASLFVHGRLGIARRGLPCPRKPPITAMTAAGAKKRMELSVPTFAHRNPVAN